MPLIYRQFFFFFSFSCLFNLRKRGPVWTIFLKILLLSWSLAGKKIPIAGQSSSRSVACSQASSIPWNLCKPHLPPSLSWWRKAATYQLTLQEHAIWWTGREKEMRLKLETRLKASLDALMSVSPNKQQGCWFSSLMFYPNFVGYYLRSWFW